MHPAPPDRVHSLRKGRFRSLLLVLLMGPGFLMGCQSEPPDALMLGAGDAVFTASAEERGAALAVLDSLQQTAIRASFDRLAGYAFTQHLRIERRAPDGSVTGFREQVRRFPPPDSAQRPLSLRVDSSGAFDGDWLGNLLPASGDTLINRAQYVLPDEAAYLAPRTREAFRYRLRPDTSLGGRTVRVVEVHAQPGDPGADRAIRHARLFVEPGTYELVGLYLVRADASLLFREDSRAAVYLQPAPDGSWVPAMTQLEARLKIPFRGPQHIALDVTFDAFRPFS